MMNTSYSQYGSIPPHASALVDLDPFRAGELCVLAISGRRVPVIVASWIEAMAYYCGELAWRERILNRHWRIVGQLAVRPADERMTAPPAQLGIIRLHRNDFVVPRGKLGRAIAFWVARFFQRMKKAGHHQTDCAWLRCWGRSCAASPSRHGREKWHGGRTHPLVNLASHTGPFTMSQSERIA